MIQDIVKSFLFSLKLHIGWLFGDIRPIDVRFLLALYEILKFPDGLKRFEITFIITFTWKITSAESLVLPKWRNSALDTIRIMYARHDMTIKQPCNIPYGIWGTIFPIS